MASCYRWCLPFANCVGKNVVSSKLDPINESMTCNTPRLVSVFAFFSVEFRNCQIAKSGINCGLFGLIESLCVFLIAIANYDNTSAYFVCQSASHFVNNNVSFYDKILNFPPTFSLVCYACFQCQLIITSESIIIMQIHAQISAMRWERKIEMKKRHLIRRFSYVKWKLGPVFRFAVSIWCVKIWPLPVGTLWWLVS